jgi:hypothetical protein
MVGTISIIAEGEVILRLYGKSRSFSGNKP